MEDGQRPRTRNRRCLSSLKLKQLLPFFAESGAVNPAVAPQGDPVPELIVLVRDLRAEVVALRESDANSREQIEVLRA
jgi:hypothetical protein